MRTASKLRERWQSPLSPWDSAFRLQVPRRPRVRSPSGIRIVAGGSFISVGANFSFDGNTTGNRDIETANDNISGSYSLQDLNEYVATATTCTASDKSAGLVYDLVDAYEVATNQKLEIRYGAFRQWIAMCE